MVYNIWRYIVLKLSRGSGGSQIDYFNLDDFIFLSSNKSIHAKGCFKKLSIPVKRLKNHLTEIKLQATKAGIKNPILVGAIPFNQEQPSILYIPYEYQLIQREKIFSDCNIDFPVLKKHISIPEKNKFEKQVSYGISAVKEGLVKKVVLSRLLDLYFDGPIDSRKIFLLMNKQNPFSYNFHLPIDDGYFVGASPELLLQKQGKNIISQPLAGSLRRSENVDEDKRLYQLLLNSIKDNHEHSLVVKSVKSTLSNYCTDLFVPESPSIIKTPLLWHLATQIKGQLVNPDINALSVACLIHPTPALCGFPQGKAYELISQLESFDRQYFGGIVGWCDFSGNGEWVVDIRCGKIKKNYSQLFAGAGIIAASVPELEWKETAIKFGTMLNAHNLYNNKEFIL